MCYMTRQLLPSPSEGALIRAGRGGRRGAERSAPGFGSRAHPGARPPPPGDRPPAPPSPWPGLAAGGQAALFGSPVPRGVPGAGAIAIAIAGGSRQPTGGCGKRARSARCFAGGASRCAFVIPPQHLEERARNLTGVLRRTSARLLRSPYFPERGRCELPWDLNHHQALQFLI